MGTKKFIALNYNVIVEERVLENKTNGGFDFTGYADVNESQKAGVVVSIGNLCPKRNLKLFGYEIPFLKTSTLKEGQTIIYMKHKTTQFTLEGKPYQIVPYPDLVLAL